MKSILRDWLKEKSKFNSYFHSHISVEALVSLLKSPHQFKTRVWSTLSFISHSIQFNLNKVIEMNLFFLYLCTPPCTCNKQQWKRLPLTFFFLFFTSSSSSASSLPLISEEDCGKREILNSKWENDGWKLRFSGGISFSVFLFFLFRHHYDANGTNRQAHNKKHCDFINWKRGRKIITQKGFTPTVFSSFFFASSANFFFLLHFFSYHSKRTTLGKDSGCIHEVAPLSYSYNSVLLFFIFKRK